MDILFSPYGVGALPKSAMAEIERRTEDLLKSSSFQRMLELEKKYKTEQSQGPKLLLPSSQSPTQLKDGPPPRPERPDILFPQEQFLMVRATQRTVIPPSLSLSIPQGAGNFRQNHLNEWEAEEDDEYEEVGTPTNNEPFQKQVKFLSPDGHYDDEDGKSEQSSICQSPSWEGYGQRKKDKKFEAERRKKEKEQAEKEAKAAKKRGTSRLSKAPPPPPPPVTTNRDSRPLAMTATDRSMSDPLLVSRHLVQGSQPVHQPEVVGRTVSADDLQQTRWHQPALAEIVSGSGAGGWYSEGMSDPSTIPHHLFRDNRFVPRQEMRRSMSEGPAPSTQQPAPSPQSKHESRSPRDAFPPSSSRTPKLRHMSPSGPRGNSSAQGISRTNHLQESPSAVPTADGARRNGYVHHQRAQVAERAMAGLADEQLVADIGQYYPPSSSSPGQTQHARRSSLTQEARSAAMKLVGIKTPSSARDGNDQVDYLTFKAVPYSSNVSASGSVGSIPASPRNADGPPRTHDHERPSTSQSSTSSSDPSTAGSGSSSHGKKSRSLRDVTKSALSRSKEAQTPVENSQLLPPYYRLKALMHSRASTHAENKTSPQATPAAASNPAAVASGSHQAKATETGTQGGSRVSEGSSSSSAYEDGSALPSSTTTPDTSRPQSAKDIPLVAKGPAKRVPEPLGPQDDEQMLHQSPDSSKSSTPRVRDSETRGSGEMGSEDRWSRTALPIDIDGDAQSFMTTVSNFDNVDDTEEMPPNSPPPPEAAVEQPKPLRVASKSGTPTRDVEPVISIPPRSRKRSQSSQNGSPMASFASTERRQKDDGATQDVAKTSEKHEDGIKSRESPKVTASGNHPQPLEHLVKKELQESGPERYRRKFQEKRTEQRGLEITPEREAQRGEYGIEPASGSPQYGWAPGSISLTNSTVPSTGPTSPQGLTPDFQMPNDPYFANLPEQLTYHGVLGDIPTSAGPPSPVSLPSPLHQIPSKPPSQPRANSAPISSLSSLAASGASTPSSRPSGAAPVSILKQPKSSPSDRPPALSAIPKHMQLQTGVQVRPPTTGMAPIAKMFVECCNCKFYHDMPSKLYECMAKPDAVVEDKLLGISGAITTMVKCPWCHHNMSRGCCAGYAAVVYLKEKLH
ncbi:hypothetical protein F5144DRAFT_39160 [Chaetomium tenue]|uniref:Uncharacterized protein n=1 Tax=Chaetomium tenue TaxID=1854479 RepID=A0ACB7PSG3_9PEZI|nr:hypothetical protein F5144DRAFT_39160 [Chaetomium globosum]